MHTLLRFANFRTFRNFIGEISSILSEFTEHNGYVQGVLLDYHPVWRDIQKLRGYGDKFVAQYFEERRTNGSFIESVLSARTEYDQSGGGEDIEDERELRELYLPCGSSMLISTERETLCWRRSGCYRPHQLLCPSGVGLWI